jgi:hypothetical protein
MEMDYLRSAELSRRDRVENDEIRIGGEETIIENGKETKGNEGGRKDGNCMDMQCEWKMIDGQKGYIIGPH